MASQIQRSDVFHHSCIVSLDWFAGSGLDDYELPVSFDEPAFRAVVSRLDAGQQVELDVHEHRHERRLSLLWTHALIVEGLYALSYPDLVAKADLRIYLSTDAYLTGGRRSLRDVITYGDSVGDTLERLEKRVSPATRRFVEPQRDLADLQYSGPDEWPLLKARLEVLCKP